MRAMNAPCEAVLFSSGEKFVLLGVIEILDIQTTLLFAERCLRKAAVTIGFERAEVVFQASNQCYVLNALAGRMAASTLRTMAALTRMFSASVACRDHVVMKT